MKLTLSKTNFVNSIVNPASKLTDNLTLEFVGNSVVKTTVTSPDNSVILMANSKCNAESPVKCVVPDCKTFLRLFSGIEQDDIVLTLDSNVIKYSNGTFSFKYHLLDEGYISEKKSISEDKINQIQYDTSFTVSKSKLSEVLKFNTIIPDAEKLYFYTDNNRIQAKIGDDQKSNNNEIVTEISSSFVGEELLDSIPLNIQNIHLMSFAVDSIDISINKKLKIVKFSSPTLQYIVSGLVR
jgi:hypothetical protein